MNTKFLLSPAYLVSIALLLAGAVLSGGRFMLVGWILCILGVGLNAMTLVVLYAMDARAAAGAVRRGFSERSAPVVQRVKPASEGPAEGPKEQGTSAVEESR